MDVPFPVPFLISIKGMCEFSFTSTRPSNSHTISTNISDLTTHSENHSHNPNPSTLSDHTTQNSKDQSPNPTSTHLPHTPSASPSLILTTHAPEHLTTNNSSNSSLPVFPPSTQILSSTVTVSITPSSSNASPLTLTKFAQKQILILFSVLILSSMLLSTACYIFIHHFPNNRLSLFVRSFLPAISDSFNSATPLAHEVISLHHLASNIFPDHSDSPSPSTSASLHEMSLIAPTQLTTTKGNHIGQITIIYSINSNAFTVNLTL